MSNAVNNPARKNILITGANRGIGLELVRRYVEQGHSVHACCRQPESAMQLREVDQRYPGLLTLHKLDVTCEADLASLVSALEGQTIDVLVNNAGIYDSKSERGTGMEEFAGPAINDIDPQEWLDVFHVNSVSPLLVTRRVLPFMGGDKKIIMISTMMGSIGSKDYGGAYVYSTSKAALNMLGKTLANDLGPDGFIVTMVHPGWVQTDMGGPNAETTVQESAGGIVQVIDDLTPERNGSFFNFDGTTREW